MRYRVDVKVEGYILVEANDPFEAHKIADLHQEDIVWDNWMTYTSCKRSKELNMEEIIIFS